MHSVKKSAAVVFLVAWACGLPDPGSDPGRSEDGELILAEGMRVQYVGAFSWQGAVQEGNGYEFTNDLGYRFRVERFHLATYSAQLRPCEPVESADRGWRPDAAYADHVVQDDASIAVADHAEDALASTWHELGVGSASNHSYCKAFILSVIPTTSDPDLQGNTIVVTGSYIPPGESQWIAFDARIPLGEGSLVTLHPDTPEFDTFESQDGSRPGARVVFTRYPVAAFAGVRPDSVSSVQLAWELLERRSV